MSSQVDPNDLLQAVVAQRDQANNKIVEQYAQIQALTRDLAASDKRIVELETPKSIKNKEKTSNA